MFILTHKIKGSGRNLGNLYIPWFIALRSKSKKFSFPTSLPIDILFERFQCCICRGVGADQERKNYVFHNPSFGQNVRISWIFSIIVNQGCIPGNKMLFILLDSFGDFERIRYNVVLERQMWRHRQCNHSWHRSHFYIFIFVRLL